MRGVRAIAQPGQPRRHPGGAQSVSRRAAGRCVRHGISRVDAAAFISLRAALRPLSRPRRAPLRLPRAEPSIHGGVRGRRAPRGPRAASTHHVPSRRRSKRRRDRRWHLRRHVDGYDASRRLDHGYPHRRPRSRNSDSAHTVGPFTRRARRRVQPQIGTRRRLWSRRRLPRVGGGCRSRPCSRATRDRHVRAAHPALHRRVLR